MSPSPTEPERLVVNTGPLIALGRVGAFEIIGRLPIAFVIPADVAREIEAGIRAGHPVAVPTWAAVHALGTAISPLGVHLFDAGEAAVIQLAVELGIKDVCIDEWRGRRAAAAVGLRVTDPLVSLAAPNAAG
jgi:predicted nucleic acid-binding protein